MARHHPYGSAGLSSFSRDHNTVGVIHPVSIVFATKTIEIQQRRSRRLLSNRLQNKGVVLDYYFFFYCLDVIVNFFCVKFNLMLISTMWIDWDKWR